MKICCKKPVLLSVFLIVLIFTFSLWTQTANAEDSSTYFATTTNANCADYYHFNGVQIDVKPNIIQSIAGADMNFSGSILNNNEYPVVSGRLFVKIFRDRAVKDNNGPDVLDAFVAQDGISIKAGEKIPVHFKWKIPAYALGGNYKIATYFITSDKFNLAGLSFTDDVVGGLSSFKVLGQQDKGVFLKKEGVKVNNNTYTFAAYPPIQSATDPVTIMVPVTNTTTVRAAVKVVFNVYKWDAQSPENIIDTSTKVAVIEPGKTIYVPMVVKDNQSSVYYTEVVLKYMDSKSILGIRFVRNGVAMPRINFPSINSYPLVAGQKNKIFACFHNASNSNAPIDGKLKIDILGDDNNPILSYEYDGKIIGEMSAVAQDFIPHSTYKDFKIHASLFEGSQLVDEVYIPYTCKEIDPNNCGGFDLGNITSNGWLMLSLEILGILILIGLIIFLIRRSDKVKVFFTKISKNRVRIMFSIVFFALFLSLHSNAYAVASSSSSDSGSGVAPGCFTVTNITPIQIPVCSLTNASNKCGIDNVVTASIQGTNLMKVGYINMATYPVKIINQTDNLINITFERLPGEWTQKISLADLKFFPKCTGQTAVTFTCKMPTITNINPTFGPTAGGTFVTITGTNFTNAKSVKIGNVTVRNIVIVDDKTITLTTPAEAAGWKSVSVQSDCWEGTFRNTDALLPNAFNYQKNPNNPPPFPSDTFWIWNGTYNSGVTSVNNPYLYYWATTSLTSNLDGGKWAQALGNNTAQISYDSSITYDSGVVVADQDIIPTGTKLHFNFDGSATSSVPSQTSQKISWNGTGYTEDTPYGSWVNNASYPDQVCVNNNFVNTSSAIDPADGQLKSIDIFVPLSVNPPGKELSFSSAGTYSLNTDSSEWGAPPLKSDDSISWSCDSPDSLSPTCTPISGGVKKVNMYYAPTYGYYYYGWRWTSQPSGVCHTNNIALHQKKALVVNNGALPQNDHGVGTCTLGTSGCTRTFLGLSGNTSMCSVSYPYYNPETNHCYSNLSDWTSSLHTDSDVVGNNASNDYYYPYKLKFGESVYSLNLNIVASSTIQNQIPSEPIITGPTTVSVNVPATYNAVSNLVVAKNKSNSSMFANIIFAVKELFAQTETPQVHYLFDWNGDGVADYVSDDVPYGTGVSASFTWESVGPKHFAVQAVDKISLNASNWKTFDITVASSTDPDILATPNIKGTYCDNKVTLTWDQVVNSDGYSLYKNGGNYFSDINNGSITSSIDTNYASSGDSYYMYAYKLPVISTTTVSTLTPPTVWTPHDSARNWVSITSSSDGSNLAAVVYDGYIYTSTDSGTTWTSRMNDANRYWRSITSFTSSSNVVNLVAVVSSAGYIYTSANSGATWTPRMTDAPRSWWSVSSSLNGSKLAAVVQGGYIYTSSNSGSTWSTNNNSSGQHNWISITSSSDGSNLAAASQNGYIYTSSNSGTTWTTNGDSSGQHNWASITSSSDGTKLAVVDNGGYVYTSTDSGLTWTTNGNSSGQHNWYSIKSSSDGTKLVATDNGGYIYTSNDSGSTWTTGPSNSWYAVTTSFDGSKLVATTWNGNIYTSEYSMTTVDVGTTTDPVSSEQSNILNSSDITKLCEATTTASTTTVDLGIKQGLKFYANPSWADNTNKCIFWGHVEPTIIDGGNNTYNGVSTDRCYVDSDIPANAVAVPLPATDAPLKASSGGSVVKENIGKHTLYCDISFDAVDAQNNPARGIASTTVDAKCSKVPNTLEK